MKTNNAQAPPSPSGFRSPSHPYSPFRPWRPGCPWRPFDATLHLTQLRSRKAKTPAHLKNNAQPFQINRPRLLAEFEEQFREGERLTAMVRQKLGGLRNGG